MQKKPQYKSYMHQLVERVELDYQIKDKNNTK